jgi:hypothetical protein
MNRELEHRFKEETDVDAREDFDGFEIHKIAYVNWLESQILKPKEDTINPKMKLSKEELGNTFEEDIADLKKEVKENYTGVLNHHRIETPEFDSLIIQAGKDNRIPDYYIGNNGYEARKVIDNFDLSYNVGTAVTYLLRAEKKHDTPIECIQKAINHLEFELDKLKR